MEALVLDTQFKSVCMIDSYESLIWTERYYGCGNFEIYTMPDATLLNIIKQDYYVWLKDTAQVMIIEEVQLSTEVETGGHLIISGRSLESILDRRIIWTQTVLSGNLQRAIEKLLNENVISPTISARKIGGFYFKSTADPQITELTIRAQYTGDNLYDVIEGICRTYNIGFCVELDKNNQFCFRLYAGTDRSYNQVRNPYIVFSPKNENLISSNYLESKKTLKNVNLVAGEDEGTGRRTRIVGTASDLSRREMFTDARDIQSELSDNTKMPDSEYNALLDQRGKEKLAENASTTTFEGKVETSLGGYIYGRDKFTSHDNIKDSNNNYILDNDGEMVVGVKSSGEYFFLGDIVQIVNEYGIEARARVEEMVKALDKSGYEMYPTFSIVEEE